MSVIKKAVICASVLGLLMIATLGFGAPPTQPTACSVFTGGNQCHVGMQGRTPVCICNPGATGNIFPPLTVQARLPSSRGDMLLIGGAGKASSLLFCAGVGSRWSKYVTKNALTCLNATQEQQVRKSEARAQCGTDWNSLMQVSAANFICGGVLAQAVQSFQTTPGAKLEALPGGHCIVGTTSAYLKWKAENILNSCVASTGLKTMSKVMLKAMYLKQCQNDVAWNVSNGCGACGGLYYLGVSCRSDHFSSPKVLLYPGQGPLCSTHIAHATYNWTPGNMNTTCVSF